MSCCFPIFDEIRKLYSTQVQGDMVITCLFEDGPALLLPLIIDPGSCHLSQQLQTLGVWRQCKLVDLEEKKTVTQLTTCT